MFFFIITFGPLDVYKSFIGSSDSLRCRVRRSVISVVSPFNRNVKNDAVKMHVAAGCRVSQGQVLNYYLK